MKIVERQKSTAKRAGNPTVCPVDQSYFLCDPVSCSTQKHAIEIETLLSIQQAITSHLDLSGVLQMIADEARRLTSAKLSFLYVLEEDDLCLSAVSGSDSTDALIGYRVPVAQSVAGQSIQTSQPIMLTDIHEDDARIYREAIEPFGNVGCYLTVPLIYENRSIGVIAVADACNAVLSSDSLRVLSMLAPCAVIGIENARLYQEQQERRLEAEGRHQMAESLRVMLAILNSNRSLGEILDYIVTHVSGRLLGCQGTAIFTYSAKDQTLGIQAANGLSTNLVDAQYLPGYGAARQAVETGRPVSVTNAKKEIASDESYLDTTAAEWAMVSQLMINFQSWLAVPLIVKGELYGTILLYFSEPRIFSTEEINLALMFSDQVALAIENARLRMQAEEAAVIAERNRLARELHDAVSQTLFSANLIAEVLPRLWERDQTEARARLVELRQLTRGAFAEMRTLLFELRPAVFKEAKLGDLLKHLTQGISIQSQIPIALNVEGEQSLSPEVKIALYRITQEALNNIVKHADPTQASVNLRCQPDKMALSICDNGCGFNPAAVSSDHFGLSIMQERAASINANLNLKSKPDCGTQIEVVWLAPGQKE
ncbi:histidine kinase [Longilinea arvoryzae]|uniref:Histidine kinase n=1 Tax=Longilinea arvoryzae TaxID=360412 RepID=A0A0S7BGL0_9CHLR|nr:GAF domain-containing sensor histidine kinase [Longilinea arvoryzae]GAP13638.1 histidine kinase [Longilinea arvoryzae]